MRNNAMDGLLKGGGHTDRHRQTKNVSPWGGLEDGAALSLPWEGKQMSGTLSLVSG